MRGRIRRRSSFSWCTSSPWSATVAPGNYVQLTMSIRYGFDSLLMWYQILVEKFVEIYKVNEFRGAGWLLCILAMLQLWLSFSCMGTTIVNKCTNTVKQYKGHSIVETFIHNKCKRYKAYPIIILDYKKSIQSDHPFRPDGAKMVLLM